MGYRTVAYHLARQWREVSAPSHIAFWRPTMLAAEKQKEAWRDGTQPGQRPWGRRQAVPSKDCGEASAPGMQREGLLVGEKRLGAADPASEEFGVCPRPLGNQ